jgi:hypothetical protein
VTHRTHRGEDVAVDHIFFGPYDSAVARRRVEGGKASAPIGSIGPTEYSVRPFCFTPCFTPCTPSARTRLCPKHKTPPTRNKLFDIYSQALQCYFIVCFTLHGDIKSTRSFTQCFTPVLHPIAPSPRAVVDCPRPLLTTPRTKSTRTTLTSYIYTTNFGVKTDFDRLTTITT